MLGKVKSLVSKLRRDVINNVPIKGVMGRIEGNGLSDPTIITSYNLASVVRTGVGVYRATLQQDTMYGIDLLDTGVYAESHSITSDPNTDLHIVRLVPVSSTEVDIEVYAVEQGLGIRIDITPYDFDVGDSISVGLYINAGNGELPQR